MVIERKSMKLIMTIMITAVLLFISAAPVSAATKSVPNGKAWNIKTDYATSTSTTLKVSSNWDKTSGGEVYTAKVVVSDWQKGTAKTYTYKSSTHGKEITIKLPNKKFKSNKYTVTVKWSKTPNLKRNQYYKASVTKGTFF